MNNPSKKDCCDVCGKGVFCVDKNCLLCHTDSTENEECQWAKFPRCPYHNHPSVSQGKESSDSMSARLREIVDTFDAIEPTPRIEKPTDTPPFTEKTLSEFREKWQEWLEQPHPGLVIQGTDAIEEFFAQFLSTKLEEAVIVTRREERLRCDTHIPLIKEIQQAERTRILGIVESKKQEIHEVDSESFGWDLIGGKGPDTGSCCPGDDAAYGYEAALTSLAEEIGS